MKNISGTQGIEHLPKNWKKNMFKIIKKYSKDKNPQKIIIASGGTGGHIFPAQSVAEILSNRYLMIWMTDKRGYTFLTKDSKYMKYIFKTHKLLSGPLQGKIKDKLYSLIKTALGVVQATYYVMYYKPAMVIGFGGYASIPMLVAAMLFSVPIVLHEQNAVLGQVNRIFIRFAKCLISGFPAVQKLENKYSTKVTFLGNPIRNNVWEEGQKRKDKVQHNEIKLLIIGGSQGAQIFCDKIPEAIQKLPDKLQRRLVIKQQILLHSGDDVAAKYKNTCVKKIEISPFFNNIGELMHNSDLIIARAGASTIAEIEYFKLPALLIPFAAAKDNHQYYNARYLEEKGTALIIQEKDINSSVEDLIMILSMLLDKKQLKKMRDKANLYSNAQVASKIAVKINQLLM